MFLPLAQYAQYCSAIGNSNTTNRIKKRPLLDLTIHKTNKKGERPLVWRVKHAQLQTWTSHCYRVFTEWVAALLSATNAATARALWTGAAK